MGVGPHAGGGDIGLTQQWFAQNYPNVVCRPGTRPPPNWQQILAANPGLIRPGTPPDVGWGGLSTGGFPPFWSGPAPLGPFVDPFLGVAVGNNASGSTAGATTYGQQLINIPGAATSALQAAQGGGSGAFSGAGAFSGSGQGVGVTGYGQAGSLTFGQGPAGNPSANPYMALGAVPRPTGNLTFGPPAFGQNLAAQPNPTALTGSPLTNTATLFPTSFPGVNRPGTTPNDINFGLIYGNQLQGVSVYGPTDMLAGNPYGVSGTQQYSGGTDPAYLAWAAAQRPPPGTRPLPNICRGWAAGGGSPSFQGTGPFLGAGSGPYGQGFLPYGWGATAGTTALPVPAPVNQPGGTAASVSGSGGQIAGYVGVQALSQVLGPPQTPVSQLFVDPQAFGTYLLTELGILSPPPAPPPVAAPVPLPDPTAWRPGGTGIPVPGNPCDWGISCMPDPPPRPPQQPTVTSLVPVDASGCGLPTPAVARVYTTTVSGVTNVTCSACNGFNQAWTLSFASRNRGSGVSDCGWDSNDPPGLCTPVGPYGNAELRYQNAGSYELLFKGSGGSNQATYTCAGGSFNGLGSSTFTRTTPAAAAGCDNWPGSLTVSPA